MEKDSCTAQYMYRTEQFIGLPWNLHSISDWKSMWLTKGGTEAKVMCSQGHPGSLLESETHLNKSKIGHFKLDCF